MNTTVATYELSERSFQKLASLIQSKVGIRMPPAKRTMVEGRLRKRVRALGMPNVEAYCRYLFDNNGIEHEYTHLIDAVTTNKTDFFREPDHFRFLKQEVVPRLRAESARGRVLKLWSAACSNGAEVYTMAMVMASLESELIRTGFSILGTDICTEVLEQAFAAIYPAEMIDDVVPSDMLRFVMRAKDPKRREYRIVPELRRLVNFQQLNLMDSSYPVDRGIDVIFCRNVLIYFDKSTQNAVLQRLCSHLQPGGYLFLGHSESMAGSGLKMQQVAATVFRRP